MASSEPSKESSPIAEGLPPLPPYDADVLEIDEAPTASEVFFAWERLRLVYNAILVAVVLFRRLGGEDLQVQFLVENALFANLCFCVGPVAEGYLVCIGLRRKAMRWLLFLGGSVLAAVGAIYAPFPH